MRGDGKSIKVPSQMTQPMRMSPDAFASPDMVRATVAPGHSFVMAPSSAAEAEEAKNRWHSNHTAIPKPGRLRTVYLLDDQGELASALSYTQAVERDWYVLNVHGSRQADVERELTIRSNEFGFGPFLFPYVPRFKAKKDVVRSAYPWGIFVPLENASAVERMIDIRGIVHRNSLYKVGNRVVTINYSEIEKIRYTVMNPKKLPSDAEAEIRETIRSAGSATAIAQAFQLALDAS
jgi:hypothetical protein